MSRNSRRFPQLAAAIAVAALAAPAGALGYVDHRSADAVDAGIQAQKAQQTQDELRRLEAQRAEPGYVDHRSPDATDTSFVRSPEPPTVAEPTIVASSGGFDWGDAGIGAGAALGLLLIGLSVTFTVVHRRNRAATV